MERRMDKPRRIWPCPGLAQDEGNACCLPLPAALGAAWKPDSRVLW